MNQKLIYFALIAFVLLAFTNSKKSKNVDNLYLIYIDNSKLGVNDGINQANINSLTTKLNSIKQSSENNKFMLFVSNGLNPIIETDIKNSNSIINQISETYYDFPSLEQDKDQLLERLMKNPFKVNRIIDVNYFISYSLARKILMNQPEVVGNLISELALYCNHFNNKKIVLNLHYPYVKGLKSTFASEVKERLDLLKTGLNIEIHVNEQK